MKKHFSTIAISLLSIFTTLFLSCKEPDSLGLDLVENTFQDNIIDTITLYAYSEVEDSIISQNKLQLISNLLGNYIDPIFGDVESSFYTQLGLSKLQQNFGTNPKIDSLVLMLYPITKYGDTDKNMNFKVYKITEDFYNDSTYYLSSQLTYNPDLLADTTFAPQIGDTVIIADSTKIKFHYRIKLNNSFAQDLIDLSVNTNAYDNFTNFVKEMKGLYIKTDKNQQEGGSILSINLSSNYSQLVLYYNDSLNYTYKIDNNCGMFTHADHNYDNAHSQLKAQLNGDTLNNEYMFVQPLGGILTKIHIPYLKEWTNKTNIGINSARLIIEVDKNFINDTANYPLPPILALVEKKEGVFHVLPDEIDKMIDGTYYPEANSYIFNITRYFQKKIIEGKTNGTLYLMARAKSTSASRVVLKGPTNSEGKMIVKIVYSKL